MFKNLVSRVAEETRVSEDRAQAAIGIVLNAADRQGAGFSEALFRKLPGARTLAAQTGDTLGAATGVIAQMIERTPGGRRFVAASMIRALHAQGFGHVEIGKLLPAISSYMEDAFGLTGFGHLGDLLGVDGDVVETPAAFAAA